MEFWMNYKNTPVHFTDVGKGKCVVLLHGFLENITMFDALTEVLQTKYRVVCVDLLGHGKTGNIGYVHTMNDMAAMVKQVLQSLKIKTFYLLGHSMGGYVALEIAQQNMNAVKGLVLLNSTAAADTEEKKIGRDRAIAVVKENHQSFIRNSIPMLFRSKCRTLFAKEISVVKKQALLTPQQGIIAALEGMKIREDKVDFFRTANFPKLMIIGKKDPVLKLDLLLEQVFNTNIETVQLANGHMSLIEDQTETIQAIKMFLKNN